MEISRKRVPAIDSASISVLPLKNDEYCQQKYFEIKGDRPVVDVEKVVLNTLSDFLDRFCLTTPSVHLRPPRNTRLDPMTRRVLFDDFLEELARGLGGNGVRSRAHE